MFLRSLTLKGFKSFAESTTLELAPGLTVVVGPNGSGKSNIVDAVAWVLGAQGPRTVRSQKMEDVIFAGNGKRPALGRAEVTLTIDNSAGLLPIGFTEVTLTRTLFRASGESEYAINGVPCRLLDLQELLSDTGVGRSQHVIVSQGNLDQVLDVRPEERRLIIEEAAGILKFRRRKEKAERRLEATENHLVRLSDLVKELRRGMRPLERQAEAARRHGDLAGELRALRLYLAGRSLAGLQARSDAGARNQARLAAEEKATFAELRSLDGDVAALEARLDALGGAGLDEIAARLGALRERARGVAAVLAERARSLAAEVATAEGGDTGLDPLARLEADAAVLAADLAATSEESDRLREAVATLAESEAELAGRRARLAAREAAEQSLRRAAEARGELTALLAAATRARAEVAEIEARLTTLDAAVSAREAAVAGARAALAQVQDRQAEADTSAGAGAAEAAARQEALAEAAVARQAAERRADAAAARVEALTLAAGPPATRDGAVAGALGSLVEFLEIQPGFEAAVEAALNGALTGLVVADVDAARAGGLAAANVPLLVASLPAPPTAGAALPAPAVRERVNPTRPDLTALVDRLLATAVVVEGGWEDALDLAVASPELTVVTTAGDRFGLTGWRLAGSTPGIAAALAEARHRAEGAAAEATVTRTAEQDARTASEQAAAAAQELAAERDRHRTEVTAAQAVVAAAEAELRQAAAAAGAERAHLVSVAARAGEDERRAARLDEQLALPLDGAPAPGGGDLDAEREDVAWESQALAARRAQLAAQGVALTSRQDDLRMRLAEAEARMTRLRTARQASDARVSRSRVELTYVRLLSESVARSLEGVDAHLADVDGRRQRRAAAARELSARLGEARRLRATTEHGLEECRAKSRRAELEDAETRLRLEAAIETLRRELDCEPDAAVAAECPPLADGTSPSSRAREVERELRLLGPVNPLAVEELAALQERDAFLTAELEDVKATRRDLARVIRSIEAEMTGLLVAAYADVSDNFVSLFETLFPGGEGQLKLTDPDHILESGVEIEARPGGKSARKLSLLSGGERSLCAMAFLFAVFRSRPSPFYLLDEVEAALDDVNLHRFLRLLDEFRDEAQLVVVSHQKRTMEAADCLFGVTIQSGGSSRVLSERVTVGG